MVDPTVKKKSMVFNFFASDPVSLGLIWSNYRTRTQGRGSTGIASPEREGTQTEGRDSTGLTTNGARKDESTHPGGICQNDWHGHMDWRPCLAR